MEGYLLKEGAGLVKGYKKRYFIVQSNHLVYYRAQGDKEPVGMFFCKLFSAAFHCRENIPRSSSARMVPCIFRQTL